MYLKAILLPAAGAMASAGVRMAAPWVRVGVPLATTAWALCRACSFLCYVIEKYIDPEYRFAGGWDAIMYLARQRGGLGVKRRR